MAHLAPPSSVGVPNAVTSGPAYQAILKRDLLAAYAELRRIYDNTIDREVPSYWPSTALNDNNSQNVRPFFEKYRGAIVEHAIDPDLWRTVGWEDESPRHYVDMDAFGASTVASALQGGTSAAAPKSPPRLDDRLRALPARLGARKAGKRPLLPARIIYLVADASNEVVLKELRP